MQYNGNNCPSKKSINSIDFLSPNSNFFSDDHEVICFSRSGALARKKGQKQTKSPGDGSGSTKANKNNKSPKAPKSYYPNTPRPTLSDDDITCMPTRNPSNRSPTHSPSFCDPNVNLDCPRGTPSPRVPTNPSITGTRPPSRPSPSSPTSPSSGNPPSSPSSPSNDPGGRDDDNNASSPNGNPNPSPNSPGFTNPNGSDCFALECPRATRPTT